MSKFRQGSNPRPAIFGEINFAFAIKAHAFGFEPRTLLVIPCRGTQTDFAARVDDAMPGHIRRTCAQCPADGARRAGCAECARDLSVRRHLAARDAANEGVNTLEKRVGGFRFQEQNPEVSSQKSELEILIRWRVRRYFCDA